jgi:hypothetical protein
MRHLRRMIWALAVFNLLPTPASAQSEPEKSAQPSPPVVQDTDAKLQQPAKPNPPAAGPPRIREVGLRPEEEKTRRIDNILRCSVDLEFPDNSIREILDYLSQILNQKLVADEAALKVIGLTLDKNITFRVNTKSTEYALDELVKKIGPGVAYAVDGEVLRITSTAEAQRYLETRIYDISPLLNDKMSGPDICRVLQGATKSVANPHGNYESAGSLLVITEGWKAHDKSIIMLYRLLRADRELRIEVQPVDPVTPAKP